MAPAVSRSSLELMLEEIQKRDQEEEEEQQKDTNCCYYMPPALPTRPVVKSRLPSTRALQLPLRRLIHDHRQTWSNDHDEGYSSIQVVDDEIENVVDSSTNNFCGNSRRAEIEQDEAFHIEQSVLDNLRMRVLKTEALLEQKTEENVSLLQQLKAFETKTQHYETKMQSMERNWQDQLKSVQINLAAPRSVPYKNARGKLGLLFGSPENRDEGGDGEFVTSIREFLDKEYYHCQQEASAMTLDLEIKRLKQKYKVWKNDFKKKLTKHKNCDCPGDKPQLKGRKLCF